MKYSKFSFLLLPLLICTSCGSALPNKYGSNKFVTKSGTTYGNPSQSGGPVSLVILRADGTGSASNYDGEYYYWEFNYIIENKTDLYFPSSTGYTYHCVFSVSGDGKRQIEYDLWGRTIILTEFYADGYLE